MHAKCFIRSYSGLICQRETNCNIWNEETSFQKILYHIGLNPILIGIFLISDWYEEAQVMVDGTITLTSFIDGL